MAPRIKTNIKFYKGGLDNAKDRPYGFVTKVNGSWRGCRMDSTDRKKIVFIDTEIEDRVIPNALYSCSLIPMKNDGGFIAKTARLVQFKGTIKTTCKKNNFMVVVEFGNKSIVYDPSSKDSRKRDIKFIADNLRKRLDLENAVEVSEDFVDNACMVKRLYDQKLFNV